MSFEIIETQEQLDKVISDRLSRQAKQYDEKIKALEDERDTLRASGASFESEISTLRENITNLTNSNTELTDKVNKYATDAVKSDIAREFNLPYELANRIKGETEEEMRQDAESLMKMFHAVNVAPLANPEGTPKGDSDREMKRRMLKELKGEE